MALAFMRRQKWWLKYLLGLVVVSFIILYIPALIGTDARGTPAEVLAEVGKMPITVGEYRRLYNTQLRRLEQLYQGRVDPAMVEQLGLKEQTLSALVQEKLMLLEARRLGLSVSDEELARRLTTSPDLQQNGSFIGAAELRRQLELRGMTLEEFEEDKRTELLGEKLEALLTDGIVVSPAEVEHEFRRRNEQIKAEYVLVDSKRFEGETAVSDDEIKARFEAKKEAYRIPEKRIVSFLRLDAGTFLGRVSVKDAEVESYYREHPDDFKEAEQACARHILVKVKSESSAEGHPEEEAKKLAQGLEAQLAKGADFAELAKKSSEDKGSATGGGDLGCFPRGRMVPEFDGAAFSLPIGQTSDLVKSSFGFHIIQVTSRREESTRPLGEVKESIRGMLSNRQARSLVEAKVEEIAQALKSGRSLEEAAQKQQLAVQKSRPFARGEQVQGLESPLLVSRAFELKRGEIEKSPFNVPRGFVFIALAEEQPSRLPAQPEVQDRVKADLLAEKTLEKALARARELKTRAEKDGLEKAAGALGLARKETPALVSRGQPIGELGASQGLEEAAFSLAEKTLSDPVRVPAGHAVIRILEKKTADPVAFENQKAALTASLRDERKQQFFRAYLNQLRLRFPVEHRPVALEAALG
jgi:peptidyl-prolyl cis-trans isomerase D